MKMKQLIAVICALIVAAVIFGTVMFFTRKDLKDAAQNMQNETSVDVSKSIAEIDTEYLFMQISVNGEKRYIKTGFLIDKYGNRHYFDLTSNEDRTPEEMYEEALKQKDFYEPESYIPQSDIPLLYESIKNINTENKPVTFSSGISATTEYYYAIMSDGIKTYPYLIYAYGFDGAEPSDYSAKSLKTYLQNLEESKLNENSFIPVPTEAFASTLENNSGNEDKKESSIESSVVNSEPEETASAASDAEKSTE